MVTGGNARVFFTAAVPKPGRISLAVAGCLIPVAKSAVEIWLTFQGCGHREIQSRPVTASLCVDVFQRLAFIRKPWPGQKQCILCWLSEGFEQINLVLLKLPKHARSSLNRSSHDESLVKGLVLLLLSQKDIVLRLRKHDKARYGSKFSKGRYGSSIQVCREQGQDQTLWRLIMLVQSSNLEPRSPSM